VRPDEEKRFNYHSQSLTHTVRHREKFNQEYRWAKSPRKAKSIDGPRPKKNHKPRWTKGPRKAESLDGPRAKERPIA